MTVAVGGTHTLITVFALHSVIFEKMNQQVKEGLSGRVLDFRLKGH